MKYNYIKNTESRKLKDNECCFYIPPKSKHGIFVDKNSTPVTGELVNEQMFVYVHCLDGRYHSTDKPLEFKSGNINYWYFGKSFETKSEYDAYVESIRA